MKRFTEDMAVIGAVRSEFKKAGDSDQKDESVKIHKAVQARLEEIRKTLAKAKKPKKKATFETIIKQLKRERDRTGNQGNFFDHAVAEGVLAKLQPEADDDFVNIPDTPRRKGDKIYSPEPYFADLDPNIYGQSSEEDDLPDTPR